MCACVPVQHNALSSTTEQKCPRFSLTSPTPTQVQTTVSILKQQQFSQTGFVFMLLCAHTFLLRRVSSRGFLCQAPHWVSPEELAFVNTRAVEEEQWSFRTALLKTGSQPASDSQPRNTTGRKTRQEDAFLNSRT